MIAPLRTSSVGRSTELVNAKFLEMLPQIRHQAAFAFRRSQAEARGELIEEVIANAYCAFAQLVRRGKAALAYPTPLAQFAICQVRAGRRVGSRMNVNDVMSRYAKRRKGFQVQRLDHCDDALGQWKQALVEDHHTPVDQQAAFRIDFLTWLSRLTPRKRRIAEYLAAGNSTSQAARRFRLSAGRISQLRQDFQRDWLRFHGELMLGHTTAVAA